MKNSREPVDVLRLLTSSTQEDVITWHLQKCLSSSSSSASGDTNSSKSAAAVTCHVEHMTTVKEDDNSEELCQGLERSVVVIVILVVVIGIVSLATIAGNALVIASFVTDQKLRSFGNYFILNLAISDLIVGLLIGVYAPYILLGCWRLSRPGCLIFIFLDYVVPLASAWNMAFISLDRYWSVARAIEYRVLVTTRRAVMFMIVPWLAGTLWYGPTVLFWSEMTGHRAVPENKCYVEFYGHTPYLIASSVVEFFVPFVTVATINILIYLNIRNRSRGLVTSSADGENQTTRRAKTLLSRDKKSARSLAILIVVFLITWAPFEICTFVNPICNFCIPDAAFDAVFWLLWVNSSINPVLYPFLQQRFRIAFLRILLCRMSKRTKTHAQSDKQRRTAAHTQPRTHDAK